MSESELAVFAPLLRAPRRSGIFTDFDGTLAEIVDDPAAARPVAGAPDALVALAERFARVAVLSGRPVAFLESFFAPAVALSGLYGLETVVAGVHHDHPLGGPWREAVDDVATVSRAQGPAGVRVEHKGLSLTLHYRGRPELAAEAEAWARAQAARTGLVVRPARMSVELHPPIDVDKGTSVLDLAADLDAVAFFGDDTGDLTAFDALDMLASRGVATVRVAVTSAEAPPVLLERADVVIRGPQGALDVFHHLRDQAEPAARR